jgi:two-component system, chemotaxis family, sensor kinase Cph1
MTHAGSHTGQISRGALEKVEFSTTVQPHGMLLVLQGADLTIQQVSANLEVFLKLSPTAALGQSFWSWLEPLAVEVMRRAIALENSASPIRLKLTTASTAGWFDGTLRSIATPAHQAQQFILELEPYQPLALNAEQATQPLPVSESFSPADSFFFIHGQVNQAIARLQDLSDLDQSLHFLAQTLHHLTQFDRVMIYRFDAQQAGAVVAESKRDDLPAYLGLHYPATDIPESVRSLYLRGLLRYIPDLTAPPVAILPEVTLPAQPPLDLSLVVLRGTDPCCVEYHQNMGVSALLVISLVHNQSLWGLMACHHQTPKHLSYEIREACKLLGQFAASNLAHKVDQAELSYRTKLRSLQSEFVQSIAQVSDLKQALVHPAPRLLDLLSAQGAAVCLEDQITTVGTTPTLEQVHDLLLWAETQVSNALFHTDALPKLYPPAQAFKAVASGVVLLQISQVRRYSILWFRPEVLQTINWAGDPAGSITAAADGSVVLSPRKSFAQWQEIVQWTALPWQACELDIALDLRSAIVGIVLHKADELARINQELERSNRELDSFAYAASHDLKEPLRGIHNYSNLLLKGYSDLIDEVGRSRLQTLVRLTRRMESLIDVLLKFSRIGQTELILQTVSLQELVQQTLTDLWVSYPELAIEIRIPNPLPWVQCDPILLSEVLTNLLSNALKYNDKPHRWIEIGYYEPCELTPCSPDGQSPAPQSAGLPFPAAPTNLSAIVFYVRDNGIGIRERHLQIIFRLFKRLHEQNLYGGGTGAGLTIAQKIIERHGGHLWVESIYGQGSTFYFTLSNGATTLAPATESVD